MDAQPLGWRAMIPTLCWWIVATAIVLLPLGVRMGAAHLPAPFGWQMFSFSPVPQSFERVTDEGERVPVQVADVGLDPRAEIDYVPHMVRLLCRSPETVRVAVIVGDDRFAVACR